MKKRKILHVLGGLDHGGAEAFIINALRFIDRSKYDFGIATFMTPKNGEKFDPYDLTPGQLRQVVGELILPKEGRGISDFIGLLS